MLQNQNKREKEKRQGKRKEKKKEKERNRRSEKKENKLEEYLLFSTPPSLPFPPIPTIHHHPYHLGAKIIISGTIFVFKSILFTHMFAFNHIIPLDIVSLNFLSTTSNAASKDRNTFAIALFLGGRLVEGNSNTLSSLHFEGRSDESMERVRITSAHESVRIFSSP